MAIKAGVRGTAPALAMEPGVHETATAANAMEFGVRGQRHAVRRLRNGARGQCHGVWRGNASFFLDAL
jgi:hypothetical protein